jgi:hypothetical protein
MTVLPDGQIGSAVMREKAASRANARPIDGLWHAWTKYLNLKGAMEN